MNTPRRVAVPFLIFLTSALTSCSPSTNVDQLDDELSASDAYDEATLAAADGETRDIDPGLLMPVTDAALAATGSLSDGWPSLLQTINGDDLQAMAEQLMLTAELVSTVDGAPVALAPGRARFSDRDAEPSLPLEAWMYQCENGGSLTREVGNLNLEDTEYSHRIEVQGYRFDQCRIPSATGEEQYIDGAFQWTNDQVTGRHFTDVAELHQWQSFQWLQGEQLWVSGSAEIAQQRFESWGITVSRVVSLDQWQVARSDASLRVVDQSSYRQSMDVMPDGREQRHELIIAGQVQDATFGDVFLSAEPAMTWRAYHGEAGIVELEGQLVVSSSSGEQLVLSNAVTEAVIAPAVLADHP